ncbi:MAG: amidohydrolase family protein [Alphaproteobacteria bacterium]|nr:amidohydrolase family protein [Alphaproteobacteria bacterium]
MEYANFFSADSHVNEPAAAWERIPADLRERGPHFVQDPPGKKGLYMVFEGHEPDPVGMTFTAGVSREPGSIQKVIENFTWEQWPGPWDPNARLGDMDKDGVKMEVLYPSMARNFFSLKGEETPLQLAGIKSYNDWLIEYCNVAPDRLIGLGILSVLDIPWAVEEMQRCIKLGHKGVILPAGLPDGMSYADPAFEPIWAAAEDMHVPVHFHINIRQGADRMATRLKKLSMHETGKNAVKRAILEAMTLTTDLVFGLVLDRHPRMKVVLAEYDIAWVLPFMTKMDGNVRRARSENPDTPVMKALPSEAIRNQVYITFQNDPVGLAGARVLDLLDNCLWASDYPHGGSTWPKSKDVVRTQLATLDEETARKIVWGNCAKLYGIA